MKQDNVTSATRKNDRSIELTITDPLDGTTQVKRYAAIRGGLAWPTNKAPAYLCIVGQEYIRPSFTAADYNQTGKKILLAEYTSNLLFLEPFYARLVDLAIQLQCRDFYVDLPEEHLKCGFLNDLSDYAWQQKSCVNIQAAPDSDNFLLGISRIRAGIDKGEIVIPKDSIVYGQLRSLTREDLIDSPEERLHAINALRHVIGSYHRFPVIIRRPQGSRTAAKLANSRPRGAMVA